MRNKLTAMAVTAALAALLTACASGGGQSPAPAPEPTTTEMMGTADESMQKDGSMLPGDMTANGDSMGAPDAMKQVGPMGTPGAMKQGDATQSSSMDNPMSGSMSPGAMGGTTAMAAPEARYVAYSSGALSAATGSGRAVLFFKADWCPTCRSADADFEANLAAIPADVTVLQVNYDTESELKRRYMITYQHTFVQIDSKGDEITRWSGGGTEELLSRLR